MAQHGGIDVDSVILTFPDGSQVSYADVEYLRQSDGITLVLEPRVLLFFPLTAVRSVRYRLAQEAPW